MKIFNKIAGAVIVSSFIFAGDVFAGGVFARKENGRTIIAKRHILNRPLHTDVHTLPKSIRKNPTLLGRKNIWVARKKTFFPIESVKKLQTFRFQTFSKFNQITEKRATARSAPHNITKKEIAAKTTLLTARSTLLNIVTRKEVAAKTTLPTARSTLLNIVTKKESTAKTALSTARSTPLSIVTKKESTAKTALSTARSTPLSIVTKKESTAKTALSTARSTPLSIVTKKEVATTTALPTTKAAPLSIVTKKEVATTTTLPTTKAAPLSIVMKKEATAKTALPTTKATPLSIVTKKEVAVKTTIPTAKLAPLNVANKKSEIKASKPVVKPVPQFYTLDVKDVPKNLINDLKDLGIELEGKETFSRQQLRAYLTDMKKKENKILRFIDNLSPSVKATLPPVQRMQIQKAEKARGLTQKVRTYLMSRYGYQD